MANTKQVGSIDDDLLAEVDRCAVQLGQTRRVFVERALRERISQLPADVVDDIPSTTTKEQ
jgi:Arc/MetJ family transcription regulator